MRGGGSEEGDTDPRTYLRVRRVLQSSTDTCDLNKCVAFIDDNTPKFVVFEDMECGTELRITSDSLNVLPLINIPDEEREKKRAKHV